nr:tRNA pseudouridine(38-40) synthase TruA [Nocardioides luti]
MAYDGGAFHGWAIQPGLRTVQASFEDALATALRLERVRVVCAGRTDTGVHARGQVVHLDVDESVVVRSAGRSQDPPLDALARRLNGILDPDVRVRRVVAAPEGFDARFSALQRRYAYRLWDSPHDVDPLRRSHVVAWDRPLDLDLLTEASAHLVGHRDFASFCRRREGATTIRTLLELSWARDASGTIEATVVADAFCHSMVRSLVGCLLAVGDGRRPTSWSAEVQAGLSRHPAVTVAHAHGLTLEEVSYPPDDELAERARLTRALRTEAGDDDG